ncbi:MAG TPA: TonB family protein [Candidatus Angelobacter sp.]|jgi:protein TonB
MKIAGAVGVLLILIGVLGYVHKYKLASPAPAPTPSRSAAPAVESDPDQAQKRVRISSGVAETLAIYKPAPQYPQMARIAHISGDVILQVTIDRTGHVTNIVAVQGHPILIQSAMDAVKQWKYRPYVLNGEAVAVESTVKIQYQM